MNSSQFLDHLQKPYLQGIAIVAIFLLVKSFLALSIWLGFHQLASIDCWLYGTALILFYIIINCLFSFKTQDKIIYYRNSIFSYAGTLFFVVFLCYILSGKTIFEAESYSWILFVFSIVYIVFFTIINLVRKIVEIAIKQDKKLTDEK